MPPGADRVLTQPELNRAVLAARGSWRHGGSLPRALERRSVAQGTLVRVTIHLVSAADYWPPGHQDGRVELSPFGRLHA